MSDEFKCECCGGVFRKGWTDEDAAAEADVCFPDVPDEDRAVVCTPCYEKIMAWMAKPRHTETEED